MEDETMEAEKGIIYVDREEGLKRVMGNAKLYMKLLDKFKADPNLAALLAAVQEADYEKAQGLVHTIKGIAANLSLTELYKQSIAFEGQIKNRAVGPGVPEAFKSCFEETIKNIDEVIKQYG
ncbi:MAG: Hpt domain-containing protein [Spirochaetaceae bacterium]|nr:Hpt domain-containing protein [Spirochaetaceae bacterium]